MVLAALLPLVMGPPLHMRLEVRPPRGGAAYFQPVAPPYRRQLAAQLMVLVNNLLDEEP